ncbi:hypothetical protein LINPERPRIM_LOCUS11633 [Linum perenne]
MILSHIIYLENLPPPPKTLLLIRQNPLSRQSLLLTGCFFAEIVSASASQANSSSKSPTLQADFGFPTPNLR